jgi:Undecaprenyl-phosphate galactose phosphotransferase WbaP
MIFSFSLGIFLRFLYDKSLIWEIYVLLWPSLLVFPFSLFLSGLYPGIGITPPEELKRITYITSLLMTALAASTFMFRGGADYSRGTFIFVWILLIIFTSLLRALARYFFSSRKWWGRGIIVLGAGQTGQHLVGQLLERPGLGLKPLAIFDDNSNLTNFYPIPLIKGLENASIFSAENNVHHVIVAMPSVPSQKLSQILQDKNFFNTIIIPDFFGFSSLWVSTFEVGGILGLEIQQRLLSKKSQVIKRCLDLFLLLVFIIPILIISILLSILIAFDSNGSILYTQERLGKNGSKFRVFKFRSMYGDGEERLEEILKSNEKMRIEYEKYHKLKNDPRITRIGHFLRKLSLDELPQVINVLKGDMSFVGPRAYLPRELLQMSGRHTLILKSLPGITGLWQVSGRNALSFRERLAIDEYYVRNWSTWLDFYILARTVLVVFFGKNGF